MPFFHLLFITHRKQNIKLTHHFCVPQGEDIQMLLSKSSSGAPGTYLSSCARESYTMMTPNLYFGALFSNQPTSPLSAQPMWLISQLQVFICPAR